ncbi:MAG: phosphoenolpyruvate synthase [Desulfarculus sp.]|nr:phosphoenolpyruvate synthase [Desulfarculus sp.]
MVVKRLGQTLRRLLNGRPEPQRGDFQDLKLKFREFKYLLRANNEVLALIAEVETRAAEGGSVGLDFIRSRYIAASSKVYKMIRHLARLSGDRYPGLVPAFDLIRHQIDDVLAPGDGEGELVLPLSAVDRGQGHLVGSKAANMAQIGRSGHPVCDGFVITTDSYRRFMQHSGLDGQVRQAVMLLEEATYQNLLSMSRQLQDKIMQAPLPPELEMAIGEAAQDLYERLEGTVSLSLRSSAIGEDSDTSFAGQYTSVLGVWPEDILNAYRRVVASLYSPQAFVYRSKNGLLNEDAEMAVLAQEMLDPLVSGVMYTRDPLGGQVGPLLVSAVYGLGLGLVDGTVTPDVFTVARQPSPRLVKSELGAKAMRVVPGGQGSRREEVPPELAQAPALEPGQVEELARLGLSLEKEFGRPQDVEWALIEDGRFIILQSRPLQVLEPQTGLDGDGAHGGPPLLEGGQTARPGAGSGPVYLVKGEEELGDFPSGAVLVTRHSSPAFAAVLHRAAAVVTDVGGVTGHMASLAREFEVPALVGCAGATQTLRSGQVVTVDAGARRVYAGRVEALLGSEPAEAERPRRVKVKPPWFRAAQLITPLTLTDPRSPGFAPARCSTFHDIIRFVHEKSFREMFVLGDRMGQAASHQAKKMGHKLPFELWIIDLGGGLGEDTGAEVWAEDVISVPGRAFMQGLLDPAIHWDRPRPVSLRGLASVFASSMLTPPSDGKVRDMGQKAFAIISGDYLNFNSRVGYHFAALDSFCGPQQNDNYISFRFVGGAATEDRRVLRGELICRILGDLGFRVERTGDAVSAFLKKYEQAPTMEMLATVGRLVLYTRQMDMLMHDMRMVDWLAKAFMAGNYNLDIQQGEG